MENSKHKAVFIKEFNKDPVVQEIPRPEPKEDQVLIRVIASTINPSDRLTIRGLYKKGQPPFIGGLEGYGEVVKAGSQKNNHLVGKKVSFVTNDGSWAQFTVTDAGTVWEIDSDVPLHCAASGVVNPMTVIGMVQTFKSETNRGKKGKGIIHTAAASALGRMMNKYCQREGIPLLNVVRRKEQVQLLKEEGAQHILNTSDENWVEQLKDLIKKQGFNVLLDAIGGGQVTEKIIENLPGRGRAYIYGKLSSEPFQLSKPVVFNEGVRISSFLLFDWYPHIQEKKKEEIKKVYSDLLKNELSTTKAQEVSLEQIPKIWSSSESNATQGKCTVLIAK